MTLKYKVIKQAEPGIKGGGNYQYYLRETKRDLLGVDALANRLADQTSLSRIDVRMVLMGLSDLIPELLLNNYSVELGELGIFSLSLKSNPAPTEEAATWRNIRDLKVNFRVNKALQKKVKKAHFERAK